MLKHLINWKNVWKEGEKKTWKRSEGLLDRYFGFERKIGINKKRGNETEKRKLSRWNVLFNIKRKRFSLESRQNVYYQQRLVLCSVIDIVLLWNFGFMGRLYLFFYCKRIYENSIFVMYSSSLHFIYSVAVLFMQNLI